MGIEVSTEKGVCHARVAGEMTIYTSGEYWEILIEQCSTRQRMELDLAQVTEMDAAGLQLLVALNKHYSAAECGLRLHNLSETVQEVMELTQLTGSFDDNIEDAL